MKQLFIPSYIKENFKLDKLKLLQKKLPKEIAICYSIQYKKIAENIHNLLKKNFRISIFSQVLGCSKLIFPKKTKAILLISNARFHGISLALESNLPVFVFDSGDFSLISEEEITKLKIQNKSSTLKYLSAQSVGFLISSKPGQCRLFSALKLKNSSKKKIYLFLSNEILSSELENFKVDYWVNFACPRIDLTSKIISYKNLNISN